MGKSVVILFLIPPAWKLAKCDSVMWLGEIANDINGLWLRKSFETWPHARVFDELFMGCLAIFVLVLRKPLNRHWKLQE